MKHNLTMPAGRYYVGDLCYVMHNEWHEVCELLFEGRTDHGCNEGVFTLANGTRFAIFSTAYGDGVYHDQYLKHYCVDAGSIGCILATACTEDIREDLGNIVDFPNDFEVMSDNGKMRFGHIHIDTLEEEEEPEDENYDPMDDFNYVGSRHHY